MLQSNIMNESHLPTLPEIQVLVSYLPRLYAEGFEPILKWEGGFQDKDGTIHLPYPQYHPLVEEFYGKVTSGGWLDTTYQPKEAYRMLKDEALVRSASLSQIRSMLTFCVRGERFGDGHWAEMIQAGHIRRILERLIRLSADLLNPSR